MEHNESAKRSINAIRTIYYKAGTTFKTICEIIADEKLTDGERTKFQEILDIAQEYFEIDEQKIFSKYDI